jgi:uncharacterized protein
MRIWIDLANSPQVLFFRPIIAALHERGHETVITSRAYAQTIELADHFGLTHTPIGGHGGEGGVLASLWVNARRARDQLDFLKGRPIDLAISHNAYAQTLAAAHRGWPCATAMDYEHQKANHLAFRLARLVIVPEAFPDRLLKTYGARRVYKYPGVKEQLYLADFRPDPDFRAAHGLPRDKILILLRPPATWAMYHPGHENRIFAEVLRLLGSREDVCLVFLPRIAAQKSAVAALRLPSVVVPEAALDGPNLIHCADLVISAGGTMNREAAVLGIPVYTTFAGRLGAVDQYLIDRGRLRVLRALDDLRVETKPRSDVPLLEGSQGLVESITEAFLSAADRRPGRNVRPR